MLAPDEHKEALASITGAFISVLLATFSSSMLLSVEYTPVILASTGASAILMFSLPYSPVSQPWNLIGGHLISAVVGVTCYRHIPGDLLSASLSIPLSMLLMHYCRCMHPPGGATAIAAVIGGESIHALGYGFVIVPVFFNSVILLSFAMAVATIREKNPFYDDE